MTFSAHDKMLAHAANRARTRPAYLAWIFGRYLQIENMIEDDLAKFLKITTAELPRLGLCLRPRAGHFADDIEQISAKFHVDAGALAIVVRLVESVEAMTAANDQTALPDTGLLMAARARKKPHVRQSKKTHDKDQSKS
jgi:uncharacterized membrane protein